MKHKPKINNNNNKHLTQLFVYDHFRWDFGRLPCRPGRTLCVSTCRAGSIHSQDRYSHAVCVIAKKKKLFKEGFHALHAEVVSLIPAASTVCVYVLIV